MKRRSKIIIGLLVVCAAALVGAGCSTSSNPYNDFNKTGFEISVFYDSNGGKFSTSDNSNLVDTLPKDAFKNGGVKLLEPGDEKRGPNGGGTEESLTRSKVERSGYFLAGWYKTREPRVDASGNMLDDYGEITTDEKKQGWIYNDKWDFETDLLEIDSDKKYDANTPVLTLYAGWIPNFTFRFYAKNVVSTDENDNEIVNPDWSVYGSQTFNKLTQSDELKVPSWNMEKGSVEYGRFPQLSGKTFDKIYLNKELTDEVTSETLKHAGTVNYERGIAENPVAIYYTTWREGVWYKITKAAQMVDNDNVSVNGNYEILNDLDFTGFDWPLAFSQSDFTGKIIAENEVTLSNISVNQINNQRTYGGLFGRIIDEAEIRNVNFENVTYNMMSGSRMQGASFGLLAGFISSTVTFENVNVSGKINVGNVYPLYAAGGGDKDYFTGYSIGLLNGNTSAYKPVGINFDITCEAVEVQSGTQTIIPCIVTIINETEVRISANPNP